MGSEFTPEAIRAEIDYRREAREHLALVREARRARRGEQSWWRRLRHTSGSQNARDDAA